MTGIRLTTGQRRRLLVLVLVLPLVLTVCSRQGAASSCPGDCNLDRGVSIDELQRSVLIALGSLRMNDCKAIDADYDDDASIGELVAAVDVATGECDSTIEHHFECPWPDLPDQDIHAFIMAGQSNMRGVGRPDELPEDLRIGDPRVLLYRITGWGRLTPGQHWFGPEIGFAHAIARACPNSRIGVLKFTRVGTGINSWLREWNEELAALVGNPETPPLYPELLGAIDEAEASAPITWEGFVWVHGTSDKKLVELAEQYGENLALLSGALREDLGAPELPIIFEYRVRVPTSRASFAGVVFAPGATIVELEKWNAQFEIPNAFATNWDRIATRDLVHLTSEGYLIGGRLLAEAFMEGSHGAPAAE